MTVLWTGLGVLALGGLAAVGWLTYLVIVNPSVDPLDHGIYPFTERFARDDAERAR